MEISLVYMVAGLSSRFGGKIKQFAKVTENETLIEYSLNQALSSDFTKIIFIVGEKTEKQFRQKFKKNYKGLPVEYAFQEFDKNKRDKPWGTADALCSAEKILNSAFIVCNGDDLYGEETFKILTNHLKNKNSNATIGYKLRDVLPEKGDVNRGIFEAENGNVKSIREVFNINNENIKEKNLSEQSLCSTNIFALVPETLELLEEQLNRFKDKNKGNRKIECLLPEELSKLIKQGKINIALDSTSEKWMGVTNPGDELKIAEFLKNKI